jgi:hypothetical protein
MPGWRTPSHSIISHRESIGCKWKPCSAQSVDSLGKVALQDYITVGLSIGEGSAEEEVDRDTGDQLSCHNSFRVLMSISLRSVRCIHGQAARLPIVKLNRAVAVAMAQGPQAGLALLDTLRLGKTLADYHLFHATRANLLRRTARRDEAATSYVRALQLCQNGVERRFLQRRLATLSAL